MTNQMKMIAGVVIVILIIAAGAIFMMSNKGQEAQPTTVTQDLNGDESTSSTASIKSLLGAGKNVQCSIEYPDQGGSGEIYVADKKMRGDFQTTVNGNSMESHMISDGEFMYMWSGAQGTKIKIDALATPSPTTQQQGADIDKEVDMKCSSWSVDESQFSVPINVQFTDLSGFLKSVPSPSSSGSNMDKSMCNQITDPQAKAACLAY